MDSQQASLETSLVMVVDDDPAVLGVFSRALERMGYSVQAFQDPVEACEALEQGESVHLLITDQSMKGMDGVSLARFALEVDPNTVTVIVTGGGDVQSAAEALRMGVVDYLLKPVDVDQLGLAAQRALHARAQSIYHRQLHGRLREEVELKTEEVERQKANLESLMVASLSALVRLLEARNPHFAGHSQVVAHLAERMGRALGLAPPEVEEMRVAGLLHDIGMIAVPDAIIDKEQGLSVDERASIREHPRLADEVLRPFVHLGRVADYVLYHHERLDGTGYPEGRSGREIPVGAQVVGAADAYAALVESRPHRVAMSPREAIATLRGAEGVWFAGRILNALTVALASDG